MFETLHDGRFLLVQHSPSQLASVLNDMNLQSEKERKIAAQLLEADAATALVSHVEIRFKLDKSFREWMRHRAEALPSTLGTVAPALGFESWDSLGYGGGPAKLPNRDQISAFENGIAELWTEFERTGIPAQEQQRQLKAEEKDRKHFAALTAAVPKALAEAMAEAKKAGSQNYYETFATKLGKLEGYRYWTGVLLAPLIDVPLVELPLEVTIGHQVARKFYAEHNRWPDFPFTVNRLAGQLTEQVA